jgi:hypothetical protein
MSADKKDDSPKGKNNWITPTVITAIIGLIGTIVTVYFGYIGSTRPLEIAATETAAARIFQLTLVALTPTPGPFLPSPTASLSPTPTLAIPTTTPTPTPTSVPTQLVPTPTAPFTRTPGPNELEFCINSRNINVRSGPGTDYAAIGILTFLDCLYFDGRNPDETWIRISPNQSAYSNLAWGWVRADLVRPQDFMQLPMILPPTATPTPEG